MTIEDQRLLTEWQQNKHLPKEVRLEEDFDRLLDVIDFIMNAPEELAQTA